MENWGNGIKNGVDWRLFYRTSNLGYSAEINKVYAEVDAWGADESVEFHFNGGGGTGTETLTSGTRGSLNLAARANEAMVVSLGLRNRGIKKRGKRERGGRSLWAGKAPAILVEPFFGDCQSDVDRVVSVGGEALLESILSNL